MQKGSHFGANSIYIGAKKNFTSLRLLALFPNDHYWILPYPIIRPWDDVFFRTIAVYHFVVLLLSPYTSILSEMGSDMLAFKVMVTLECDIACIRSTGWLKNLYTFELLIVSMPIYDTPFLYQIGAELEQL